VCNKDKELTEFHKQSRGKQGRHSRCKQCRKSEYRCPEKAKRYYEENKERARYNSKKYYEKNKEKMKITQSIWDKNNYERLLIYKRNFMRENNHRYKDKQTLWISENKPKLRAYCRNRQAKKLNATPKWSDLDKIQVLYEKAKWLESLTGLKYHVDHIIPLQGKNVCGLHVWENLQILEASINISKSNNFNGGINE
jgi:hypothetical protein